MSYVKCPVCGRRGYFDRSSEFHSNDNDSIVDLVAPRGFRKVQIGWNSEVAYLFCKKCSVPAIREAAS
jgi:hypothetical protein